MKKILLIFGTLIILFISCNGNTNNTTQNDWRTHSEYVDFSQYEGKTIKTMYHLSQSGNYVIIEFTDNTTLKLFANKYVIDVEN